MELCLDAIDEFLSHPIARQFDSPVIPGTDAGEDYLSIIKNPIDLSTIREKIEKKEYPSLHSLEKDIELCWSNAELYNSGNEFFLQLISECRIRMRKVLRNFGLMQTPTWCSECQRLNQKLTSLVASAPIKAKLNTPLGSNKQKHNLELFSERDLSQFLKAVKLLNPTPEHQREFVKIIRQHSHDIVLEEGENNLDLKNIPLAALHSLMTYVRDSLQKDGKKYPE